MKKKNFTQMLQEPEKSVVQNDRNLDGESENNSGR